MKVKVLACISHSGAYPEIGSVIEMDNAEAEKLIPRGLVEPAGAPKEKKTETEKPKAEKPKAEDKKSTGKKEGK